jgi:hypothetical protein
LHPEHFVRAYVVRVRSGDTLILRSGPGTRFESVREIPRDGTSLIAFDEDRVCDGDTWWLGGIPSNGRVFGAMWVEVSLRPFIRSRLNRSAGPCNAWISASVCKNLPGISPLLHLLDDAPFELV